MLSSRLAFLSLVLGTVGYVHASPLSNADSAATHSLANAESCDKFTNYCDPPTGVPCSSKSDIDNALAKYASDVSVFWGGRYPSNSTTSVESAAIACAKKQKGGATIGMVLCQQKDLALPKLPNDPLWQYASEQFGARAKGKALVTLGAALFEKATFFSIELPALIENKQVSSIVSVDVGSKDFDELCYWHCADGKVCPVGIISYTAVSKFI
jgi:hypothetical protein